MSTSDDKTRILPPMARAEVGTQLSGIYELDERIASGGMGEVFRGHNIQTGDHVAIKIVLPEFARDQTILSLFRKEASILNHLSHDAVVRYHVFTIDPGIGRPYLAMEFVNGESLFDMLRRGPMATEDVRRLCHRVASGLSFVHSAGAVHRDLSPDNVILPGGSVDRAKIIDFGIARSASVGGETLIGGRFAGKYNYVSPEQLGLYGGEVSDKSDIYSLGLVLAAALRGKPIDMNGSQFEVVEKRRSVPDLAGIDEDFRPIIEAMLQPDPQDRPTGAEIARMTRDDTSEDRIETSAPRTMGLHGRPAALPGDAQTAARDPWAEDLPASARADALAGSAPPASTDGRHFVPHQSPVRLPPRPPPSAARPAAQAKPPRARAGIVAAAVAALTVAAGGGAYLAGFLTFEPAIDSTERPRLSPDLAKTAVAEDTAKAAPSAEMAAPAPSPMERPAAATAESEPEAPAAGQQQSPSQADAETGGQAIDTKQAAAESVAPVVLPSPIAPRPETAASREPPTDAAPAQPVPTMPSAPSHDAAQTPPPPPPEIAAPPEPEAPVKSAETPTPSEELVNRIAQAAIADAASKSPPASGVAPPSKNIKAEQDQAAAPATADAAIAPKPKPAVPAPAASAPAPSPPAPSPPAPVEAPVAPKPLPPAAAAETTVAMNVPKPQSPAAVTDDDVASRVSWVRAYHGGDCFYATTTSATDKAIDIEGFGTTAQPFVQMLGAFQAKFGIEPDVSVRLIEETQCEVARFLEALGSTAAEKPNLTLDRTSVPSGSPISGTLQTRGGLHSSLLLIDNDGMAYNLDGHVVVQSGKATFSIPISLDAADRAEGKVVPQIVIAITGDSDIAAAAFDGAEPASVLLPKIFEEIQKKPQAFSATAKYFRLGG